MTPSEAKQILNNQIMDVVSYLLPAGVQKGSEWSVGSVAGEAGRSLCVKVSGPKVGIWRDFANPEFSGDILSLWQAVRGKQFAETFVEIKNYLGVSDEPKLYPKKTITYPERPNCTKPKNEMTKWLTGRGITEKAISDFKLAQKDNATVFPFLSPDGNLELVKYREIGAKKIWSNKEPVPCLFGWQAMDLDTRDVVICEGEIDCLTWHCAGFSALSIPFGAGAGNKQISWIEHEYQRLERFEFIYLSMDMDTEGGAALGEIIDRLGRYRCKVVNLPFKDANECWCKKDGQELLDYAISTAETIDPEELKSLSSFHDEIVEELNSIGEKEKGMRLPWAKVGNDILCRPAEISLWAGINSHGKTTLLSQVEVDGISQGERFCVASMEMKPRKLGKQMYRQISGVAQPGGQYLPSLKKYLQDSIWIFEAYGTTKGDRILEVFEYARKRYGVTQFVVDSLAKCGFAEDDYNKQKQFVDRLMEFSREHNVHVHVVVHMRKRDDENKIPNKMDIKGTGALTDMVDNVFIVWRNKPKEADMKSDDAGKVSKAKGKPDAILKVVKQRETGVEPTYGLWWHGLSNRFMGYSDEIMKQYLYSERN